MCRAGVACSIGRGGPSDGDYDNGIEARANLQLAEEAGDQRQAAAVSRRCNSTRHHHRQRC